MGGPSAPMGASWVQAASAAWQEEGRSCAVVSKLGFILFFDPPVCQKLLVEVEASSLGVG